MKDDTVENGGDSQSASRPLLKLLVFVLFSGAALATALLTPVGEYFSKENIQEVTEQLGAWGPVVIVVFGAVTPLFFLPRWPVAFVSGLLYGVVWGTLLATAASTLGAWLHYYLARGFLAPMAERTLARFRLSRDRVPQDKMFMLFFFLRAFPLSNFVVTNLLGGALKVRVRTYLLASFLGMLPSSVMYASWGKLMKRPSSEFYWVAALTVILVAGGIVLAQKRFLPWLKKLRESGEEDDSLIR